MIQITSKILIIFLHNNISARTNENRHLELHQAVDILDIDYILQVVGCYHPQDMVTAPLDKTAQDKHHRLFRIILLISLHFS